MRNWKFRGKEDLIAGCLCPRNADGTLKQLCDVVEVRAGLLFVQPIEGAGFCRVRVPLGAAWWVCRDGARKELYQRFAV